MAVDVRWAILFCQGFPKTWDAGGKNYDMGPPLSCRFLRLGILRRRQGTTSHSSTESVSQRLSLAQGTTSALVGLLLVPLVYPLASHASKMVIYGITLAL